jgi:preprotein translocase subunit YajC
MTSSDEKPALQISRIAHSFRAHCADGVSPPADPPFLFILGAFMFATPAFAQAPGAPAGGAPTDMLLQFAPLVVLFVLFYFLLIRPQQQRAKKHAEDIKAVKRGDNVVLTSGVLGKVTSVGDTEVTVEIAPKIEVKVVKSMISDIRTRGAPTAANDAKS